MEKETIHFKKKYVVIVANPRRKKIAVSDGKNNLTLTNISSEVFSNFSCEDPASLAKLLALILNEESLDCYQVANSFFATDINSIIIILEKEEP